MVLRGRLGGSLLKTLSLASGALRERRAPWHWAVDLLRPLKMVCEPQLLSLESVFKASSRYSEHIRNKRKPRKFHSEAVGSSEVLACTGPISRNPLVTRSVGILLSCWFFSELLSWPGTRRKICKTPKTLQAEIRMTWVTVLFATSAISPLWDPPILGLALLL